MQDEYKVLGVMSGTSLDGIDLAVCRFQKKEQWSYTIEKAKTLSYSKFWKEKLQKAVSFSSEMLLQLNEAYTIYLGQIIKDFIENNKIHDLDAVCSHGHTILHQPSRGITLQIGNLSNISKIVEQTVVCDFRVQDVQLGGQGAPLVPIGDQLLFGTYDYCLNLGGFANVSRVQNKQRIAYDICPVNIVMNVFAAQLGVPYDDKGAFAKSGTVSQTLLAELQRLSFYKKVPPKSLGLEWVKEQVFPLFDASHISSHDKLRTFTEHIAFQIARQFHKGAKVLVTGGGAYNTYLLERVKFYKDVNLLVPSPSLIEFKEALIFGFLGILKLRNEVNCLSSVTGAHKDHSTGIIYSMPNK